MDFKLLVGITLAPKALAFRLHNVPLTVLKPWRSRLLWRPGCGCARYRRSAAWSSRWRSPAAPRSWQPCSSPSLGIMMINTYVLYNDKNDVNDNHTGVYIVHFNHSPPPLRGIIFFLHDLRPRRSGPDRLRGRCRGGGRALPKKFSKFLT